jgi:prophage DNA circulation protein
MNYVNDLVAWLQAKFNSVSASERRIMSAIDDLTAAVKAAETKLDGLSTVVESLRKTVFDLNDKIAATPSVDPQLSALATELNQHVASADAVLNPPAVATP